MSSDRLGPVVTGARPPGLYRWLSRAHPAAVRRELASAGWDLHCLDGTRIRDAAGLFDACADSLQFPAYFGNNWDALQDCLGDLSWLAPRPRVILWDRAGMLASTDPEAWSVAQDVFATAAKERANAELTPVYTLVRGDALTNLPIL